MFDEYGFYVEVGCVECGWVIVGVGVEYEYVVFDVGCVVVVVGLWCGCWCGGWGWCSCCGFWCFWCFCGCGCGCVSWCFDDGDDGVLWDFFVGFDFDFFDGVGDVVGYFYGGFIGFECDECLFFFDYVVGFYVDFDDIDVVEIVDIWNFDFDEIYDCFFFDWL